MNEYESWSIALGSMINNQDKFQYYKIGKDSNNNSLKFNNWLTIPNNYFATREALTGDFKTTFKNVDLGGGDQTKIIHGDSKTINNYRCKIV